MSMLPRTYYTSNGTRVRDLPDETIITDFYRCKGPLFRRCGYRTSDSHHYIGAPSTPHRPVIHMTLWPCECPKHGRRYLQRITDLVEAKEPEGRSPERRVS